MSRLDIVRVVPFSDERVPNPYPKGRLPWQVYHTVRNAVVRACRLHGPTGPMGECPISRWRKAPCIDDWKSGDPNPTYWIIDDQYNYERYLYAEILREDAFHHEWLADVVATLADYPGWGIGINSLIDHYILIFSDRLLVKGPQLVACESADAVLGAVPMILRESLRQ